MKRALSLALLGAFALGGCNTVGGMSQSELLKLATANTAAFCDIARPIYWSRKDTLATIQQIKTHNAVGKMCGWKGK